MSYVAAYAAAAIVFLALDALWLGVIAGGYYSELLGDLRREHPDYVVAAAFYLVYVVAIVALASVPSGSTLAALGAGAILGLAAYGAYEFTNLATLKGWPRALVPIDLAWGTALTALAAAAGRLAFVWARGG